jgi:hypothetical protein
MQTANATPALDATLARSIDAYWRAANFAASGGNTSTDMARTCRKFEIGPGPARSSYRRCSPLPTAACLQPDNN